MNYTFSTYINDYLDNQGGRTTSTLYDGGTDTGAAFSISSGSFSALSSFSVPNSRGVSVTETQDVYVGAYARYDSGSSYSVIADKPRASYSMSFSSPLPLCWYTANSSANCDEADRVETNTVIRMLGSDWLVLDYTSNGENVTSIMLGKVLSSAAGMVPGDVLWIGSSSKATLSEFSMTGSVRGVPKLTSFKVETPADGAMVAQLVTGNQVNVSGVTLRVNRVYLDENSTPRADVTAMSRVLTLSKNLNVDSTSSTYWYADITSTTSGNSSAISRLLLYSTFPNPRPGDKLMANDSMTILPGEPAFELTYQGLATTNTTYDMLNINIQNSTMQYSDAGTWTGPFVEIVSGVPEVFRYSSGNTTINRSIIRIALADLPGTTGVTAAAGTPLIQGSNGYWMMLPAIPAYAYSSSESASITFSYSANQSFLCVSEFSSDSSGDVRYICALIDPGQGNGGQFVNSIGSPTATMLGYNSSTNDAPSKAANFVTDRGSRIVSVASTSLLIEYAKSVVRTQFLIRSVAQNATAFAPANVVTRGTLPATGLVVSNPNSWWCFCKGQAWCFWCK